MLLRRCSIGLQLRVAQQSIRCQGIVGATVGARANTLRRVVCVPELWGDGGGGVRPVPECGFVCRVFELMIVCWIKTENKSSKIAIYFVYHLQQNLQFRMSLNFL